MIYEITKDVAKNYPLIIIQPKEESINKKPLMNYIMEALGVSQEISVDPAFIYVSNNIVDAFVEYATILSEKYPMITDEDIAAAWFECPVDIDEELTGYQVRIDTGAAEDFKFGLDDNPGLSALGITSIIDWTPLNPEMMMQTTAYLKGSGEKSTETMIRELIDMGLTLDELRYLGMPVAKIEEELRIRRSQNVVPFQKE